MKKLGWVILLAAMIACSFFTCAFGEHAYYEVAAGDGIAIRYTVQKGEGDISYTLNGIQYLCKRETGNASVTGYNGSSTDLSIPEAIMVNESLPVLDAYYVQLVTQYDANGTPIQTSYQVMLENNAIKRPSSIPSTIGVSVGQFYVNSIADYAFIFSNLESVSIPSSVVTVGENAFAYSEALETIAFQQEVYLDENGQQVKLMGASLREISGFAFANCSSLKSVRFSQTLERIGASAFESCTSLETITIPEYVNKLDSSCFANCTSLVSCTFDSSDTSVSDDAFSNTSESFEIRVYEQGIDGIPQQTEIDASGVPIMISDRTAVVQYAARNNKKVIFLNGVPGVLSVSLPEEVKIGETVNLSDYIGAELPVTSIVSSNTSVLSVDANAKTITGAAQGTSTLTVTYTGGSSSAQVVVYQPVTSFELTPNPLVMFAGTTMPLQVANVQPSGGYGKYTWSIDSSSVGIVAISEANDTLCSLAGIKEGTATITCTNVSGTTATCRVIVRPAETANSKLTLPAALTEIEEEAFYGAPAKTVELGANVSSVGARAFAYCESLVDVIIRNGNCVISDNAFEGCVNITIFCPAGSAVASWAQARTIECLPLSLLDGN